MEFHKHYYSTDFRLETDFLFYFQIMFGNTHLDLYLNLKLFTQQCSKHYDSIWICLLFPFHSNFSCSWAVTLNKNRLNSFKSENAIRSTRFAQSKMLVDFFPIVVVGIIYWLFFKKKTFFCGWCRDNDILFVHYKISTIIWFISIKAEFFPFIHLNSLYSFRIFYIEESNGILSANCD